MVLPLTKGFSHRTLFTSVCWNAANALFLLCIATWILLPTTRIPTLCHSQRPSPLKTMVSHYENGMLQKY